MTDNRNNVVKFPQGKKAAPVAPLDTSKIKQAIIPRGSTVKAVLAWLWLVVRLPVFLVMYWLRLPVIFLCNLVSVPLLLVWLFAWYAFPDKPHMVWSFGIMSFLAFAIAWLYDFVLMAISPQDMFRSL